MKKILSAFGLVLICSSMFAQPGASVTEADAAITRLREGLVDSFNKGDIDRVSNESFAMREQVRPNNFQIVTSTYTKQPACSDGNAFSGPSQRVRNRVVG